MPESDRERLMKMKAMIEAIEENATSLMTLGEGLPAVEKNSRNILSLVFVLKRGVSDMVDIEQVV